MALKIKEAHIEALRNATEPFMNTETETVYCEAGLSEKRYRWDAFWSACRHTPTLNDVVREIYAYADDTHIDSVLKMLVKESRERVMIGTVVFRCGGTVVDESPVYAGEAPDGIAVYERAKRAVRILNPTMVGLLPQCERRFHPTEAK